ncbi:zinc-binding dehydrogenase [Actinokineospora sp.]|uniref:zinc-binding dehydrogenase n=1 Tax=Actinokineospora sp. TaxID=1872133 RepID=UPI0040381B51
MVLRLQRHEFTRDPAKALVRVEAAGIAPVDLEMMRGRFVTQPKLPFIAGYDVVGTVVEGPAELVGTRVAAMPRTGGWASQVELDPATLVPVPAGLDPAEAVALVTNGVTAWQLVRAARIRAGATVLVHGASGAVGSLLVRFALRAGARVIGTASRLDAVRAAGATPVDYRGDVAAAVRAAAPGGVDAVFDPLGGRSLATSYRLLAPGGTVLSYGAQSTEDGPRMAPYLAMGLRVAGWEARRLVGLGRGRRARIYSVTPDARFRADLAEVLALAGELPVDVSRYALADAPTAIRDLLAREVKGKAVLLP